MNLKPLLLLALVPLAWSSASLNTGVYGPGSIQSGYPLNHESIETSLSSFNVFGSAMELKSPAGNKTNSSYHDINFALSYGILPFLEVGLLTPFHIDIFGNQSTGGIGDVTTSFKFQYPPYPHKESFSLSYLLQIKWPSGSKQQDGGFARSATHQSKIIDTTLYIYNDPNSNDSNEQLLWASTEELDQLNQVADSLGQDSITLVDSLNQYNDPSWQAYSSNSITYVLKLLMSADIQSLYAKLPMMAHLNFGLAISESNRENAFLFGLDLEYWIKNQYGLFWSMDAQANVSHSTQSIPWFSYPLSNTLGLNYPIEKHDMVLTGGLQFALNQQTKYRYEWKGPEATPADPIQYSYNKIPNWGLFVEISSEIALNPKDEDGDGIPDHKDRCPYQPEDPDGFMDFDGCLDADNDNDGVPDPDDACPSIPGKDKGCPPKSLKTSKNPQKKASKIFKGITPTAKPIQVPKPKKPLIRPVENTVTTPETENNTATKPEIKNTLEFETNITPAAKKPTEIQTKQLKVKKESVPKPSPQKNAPVSETNNTPAAKKPTEIQTKQPKVKKESVPTPSPQENLPKPESMKSTKKQNNSVTPGP
jgi:hypothetical protein